jgi:hypothetical protein
VPSNYLAQDFTSGMSTDGFVGSSAGFYGVQTLADMSALPPPGDKTAAEVEDALAWYFYDAQSLAVPDGLNVVIPDVYGLLDPGRWLLQSGGGVGPTPTPGTSIPFNASFRVGSTRNSPVVTDVWAFTEAGAPMSLSPISFPFPCVLIGMTAACAVAGSWVAEVYKNADIVSGVPTGAPLVQLPVTGLSAGGRLALPEHLLQLDQVAVFIRGTGVDHPRVDLYFQPNTTTVSTFRIGSSEKFPVSTDSWLRTEDGVPMNMAPLSVPFDCGVTGMVAECATTGTWVAEVYLNADIVPGVPTGVPVLVVPVTAATISRVLLAIPRAITPSDKIAIFMRGTGIDRPRLDMFMRPALLDRNSFRVGSARDSAVVTDVWLSTEDGMAMDVTPLRVPFGCDLVGISGSCSTPSVWSAEVYMNADIVGGVPAGAPVATLVMDGLLSNQRTFTFAQAIFSADKYAVFLRGIGAGYPHVDLYLKPRAC